MTTTIERAIHALENNVGEMRVEGALNILRAALAAPAAAPEPVAWINGHDLRLLGRQGRGALVWCDKSGHSDTPLYLHPPATAPEQPAWHDAPTAPGVWFCDEGDICYTWTAHNIEILDQFDPGSGLRWYGPIPQEPAP